MERGALFDLKPNVGKLNNTRAPERGLFEGELHSVV